MAARFESEARHNFLDFELDIEMVILRACSVCGIAAISCEAYIDRPDLILNRGFFVTFPPCGLGVSQCQFADKRSRFCSALQ